MLLLYYFISFLGHDVTPNMIRVYQKSLQSAEKKYNTWVAWAVYP